MSPRQSEVLTAHARIAELEAELRFVQTPSSAPETARVIIFFLALAAALAAVLGAAIWIAF